MNKQSRLFCLVLLVCASIRLCAEQSDESAKNKIYAAFWGEVQAAGAITLSLANGSASGEGEEGFCNADASTGIGQAEVMADRVYHLHVVGSEVYDIKLSMVTSNTGDADNDYWPYYRDPHTGRWQKFCAGAGPGWNKEIDGQYPGLDCEDVDFWIAVMVRKERKTRPLAPAGPSITGERDSEFGTWTRDEGYGDPNRSPGDEIPLNLSHVGQFDPSAIGIRWSMELGRLWDASSAGKLQFVVSRLSSDAFTAKSLSYSARSSDTNLVDVLPSALWSTNDPIKQIKTPQVLVNVVSNSAMSFQLNVFTSDKVQGRGTNGYFQLVTNASPFVVWKFDSPGSSTNSLRITELRENYRTNETTLTYTSTNTLWTLTRGSGSDTRVEEWTVVTNISASVTNRIEIAQVRDGSTNITEKTATAWRLFNWGYEKVAITNDPGGLNLVTTHTYGTDTNSITYKRLTYSLFPDGFWEERFYNDVEWSPSYGRIWKIVRPWMEGYISPTNYQYIVDEHDHYDPIEMGTGASTLRRYFEEYGNEEPESTRRIYAEANEYYSPCEGGSTVVEIQETGNDLHYGDYVSTEVFTGDDVLGGKVWARWNTGIGILRAKDSFDYEWGTVTNFTFTLSANGTALRQSVYHGAHEPLYEELSAWELVEYGSAGSAISELYLHPSRSTKDVFVVNDGFLRTKEKWVFTGGTNYVKLEELRVERDILGHVTNAYRVNLANGYPLQVIYQADWSGTNAFPGNRKISETDGAGVKTSYTYDTLGRIKTRTKTGATLSGYPTQSDQTQSITYDTSDRVLSTVVSGGSLGLTNSVAFDRAGRVIREIGAEGLTNSYSYSLGGRQVSIVTPSGATKTNLNYLDRRLKSSTGTAEVNKFYTYGLTGDSAYNNIAYTGLSHEQTGATNSSRWTQTLEDTRGREGAWRWPQFRQEDYCYKTEALYGLGHDGTFVVSPPLLAAGITGWPSGFGGPDLHTATRRNIFGDVVIQGVQRDPVIEWNVDPDYPNLPSLNQVTTYTNLYKTNTAGHWFFVTEESGYFTDDSATPTLLKSTWTRATGFVSNQVSEVIEIDFHTNVLTTSITVLPSQRRMFEGQELTNPHTANIQRATNVTFNGLLQTEPTFSVSTPTWHYYDGLGRETATVTPLGNASGTLFNSKGQVLAVTNTVGEVTSFTYYEAGERGAGLKRSEINPGGKRTYFDYNWRGELVHTWGDVPYPEERAYNSFGDLVSLGTFQGGSGWSGASWPTNTTGTTNLTLFKYDEATGLLTNKVDAAGQVTTYTYYDTHELLGVIWSRTEGGSSVGYTNYLSPIGDLILTKSSDGALVTYTNHNRLGLPRGMGDASGAHVLTYDALGRQVSDQCTNGLLAGITVSNSFNYTGRSAMSVLGASSTLNWSYGYDSSRRLSSITNGALTAAYTYQANSDLVATMTGKSNTTTVLTTTRSWDGGARLKSIENKLGGTTVINSTAYAYDARGRRIVATQADNSFWRYDYNDRDEVTQGKHYWPGWKPMPGQQFEYAYDSIGNRDWTKSGGDENGLNLRHVEYNANSLNQITSRTNASSIDVIGATLVAATNLTVNGSTNVFRQGEYYQKSLSVANSSGGISQPVTNSVTYQGTNTTIAGSLLIPKVAEAFAYDTDGNLTSDSLWHYKWDPANRLVEMTNTTALANSNRLKLAYTYDYLGRRVRKQVFPWASTNWSTSASLDLKFVYDGWLLLAELTGTNLVRSYTWGLDLAGQRHGLSEHGFQKAGGASGLTFISFHGATATNVVSAYDGNGNLTGIIAAGGNYVAGAKEYGPFSEQLRISGELMKANPFGYSTKYADSETGLVYFGYRYLSTTTGRWLGRDPLDTADGPNLYALLRNNPIRTVDKDGRLAWLLVGWLVFELAMAAYDTWQLYDVLSDPHASKAEKVVTASGTLVGLVTPGGGYGRAGRVATRTVERALDNVAKKKLREQARRTFERETKKALGKNVQVHHRLPLEWAHLFPFDPNAIKNLAAVDAGVHSRINAVWREFRESLNGRTPTPSEVLRVARRVDEQFGHLMELIK